VRLRMPRITSDSEIEFPLTVLAFIVPLMNCPKIKAITMSPAVNWTCASSIRWTRPGGLFGEHRIHRILTEYS